MTTSNPSSLVFVLSPFGEPFDRHYKKIIQPSIERVGFTAKRADELVGAHLIVRDIWRSIRHAQIVLAEMTGKNPNVLYEVGLSHAIGKPVVMITQEMADIPFDLKAIRCIVYSTKEIGWDDTLKKTIRETLVAVAEQEDHWIIEKPTATPQIHHVKPKDFRAEPFNNTFYEILRSAVGGRKERAKNLKIREIVVLHYIEHLFQIGFRAYRGLSLARPDADGSLPLYVSTDWGGPAKTVNFFEWNDEASAPAVRCEPPVSPKSKPFDSMPARSISAAAGPRHVGIFQFYHDQRAYNDPRGADFFHVNPFPVDDAILDHYVVVRNKDLVDWNPNKFIFKVKDDGTTDFSLAVYETLTRKDARLAGAQEILSKFLSVRESNLPNAAETREHFVTVTKKIAGIFNKKSFKRNVTVFWTQRKANETNLFLAYVFPPRQVPR